MARRRMNGSATARISMAVTTRVSDAGLLERVLQRQPVDDGGQHAHVVGGGAVHALGAGRQAAEDVAAADDDGGLDAEPLDFADVHGDPRHHGRIDAELLFAHQGFARQLEEDSLVDGGRIRGRRMTSDQRLYAARRARTEHGARLAPGLRRRSRARRLLHLAAADGTVAAREGDDGA